MIKKCLATLYIKNKKKPPAHRIASERLFIASVFSRFSGLHLMVGQFLTANLDL